jgi:broad specificity phosphatase PhoE
MGSLVLVRHGQASADAVVYDKLSPLGEAQARKLGAHWARRGETIDRIYCGPRLRQQRSAELAVEAFRAGGGRASAIEELSDLDEMRIEPLLQDQLRALCERQPLLRDLASEMLTAQTEEDRGRARRKLGMTVLRLWNKSLISAPGVESWQEFRARVRRALDQILRGAPRGARFCAFTSAGVIGAATQLALDLQNEPALELGLQVRNASCSQFLFSLGSEPRFSLASFNEVSHFAEEPKMVTSL